MDVGKRPLCLQVYERGRTNEGGRPKRRWDGNFQCEAETAIAVQDTRQHSIRHSPVALIAGKRSRRSIPPLQRPRPSTSSASRASDTVEACEHFQRNGWSFFLTGWDDDISTEAIHEVDAAWSKAATLCTSSTPEDLMQTALLMVSEAAQTSHFHEVQIPDETTRRNLFHNETSRIKFTDKLLKRDTGQASCEQIQL